VTARSLISAALAGAFLLAGCGGGSQSSSGIPSAPSSQGKKGKAILRIRVPKKATRIRRHGHYISPATQAMTLAISGPTPLSEQVNLTAGSTGCTSTATSTNCQLTLTLSPGAYTATIDTYDSTTVASGHLLSSAQNVGFDVVTGASNAISLTLSGVPASLLVVPATAASVQNPSGTVDLLGTNAHKFIVEALDASGNIIVGAGSPTYAVAKSFGNLAVGLTQPTAGAPDAFYVTPPSSFSQNTATLAVTAAYTAQPTNGCALTGANCTTTVIVDMKEILAVADPIAGGSVVLYELPSTTPFATITGANVPTNGLAFDGNDDLFVANCQSCAPVLGATSSDAVYEYAPPYNAAPIATIPNANGIANPVALVIDSSDDVFVANNSASTITEYALPYGAATATLTTGVFNPTALALDATNDLFAANNSTVTAWAPPYTNVVSLAIANGIVSPIAIGFEPATAANPGALLVTNCTGVPNCASAGAATVTVYNAPQSNGQAANFTLSAGSGGNGPLNQPGPSLAFDSTGDVFVPSRGSATPTSIPRVATYGAGFFAGETSTPNIVSGIATPLAVAVDGLNDLFVANATNVTVYAPNYTGAPFATISSGLTHPVALAILP
jgi:hypothetical protein